MPVNVIINGTEYKEVKELEMFGVVWRPAADVIDKPTAFLRIIGNGDYDVTNYAKVKVRTGHTSYSNLSVELSSTEILIGSTEQDILNFVSRATIYQISGGQMGLVELLPESLTVVIVAQSGRIESGVNNIRFIYEDATYDTKIDGVEAQASITQLLAGYSISELGGSASGNVKIVNDSISLILSPEAGYRFFNANVTVTEKVPGASTEIDISDRVVSAIVSDNRVSVTIPNAISGAAYTVSAFAVDKNSYATISIKTNNAKLLLNNEKYTEYIDYIQTTEKDKVYNFVADANYTFGNASTFACVASDGSTPSYSVDRTGSNAALTMNTVTGGITYNIIATSEVIELFSVLVSKGGTNVDQCTFLEFGGMSGNVKVNNFGFLVLHLTLASGYSLTPRVPDLIVYVNSALSTYSVTGSDSSGYTLTIPNLHKGDSIQLSLNIKEK